MVNTFVNSSDTIPGLQPLRERGKMMLKVEMLIMADAA